MNQQLFSSFKSVLYNEPMSKHTSFCIGGAADVFITPQSVDEIRLALCICRDHGIPVTVVGNGTNMLVSDLGIEGVVLHLGKGFDKITVENGVITACAGAKLCDVCRAACDASLSGLEFAYGIPGSVGGGVYMNAGAYGGSLSDVCVSVTAIVDGELKTYSANECDFYYRHSRFCGRNDIVVSAAFALKCGDKAAIKAAMDDVMQRRKDKQPLEFPSAGSVFRRPEGHFAGALIEAAGLKGLTVGAAQVSKKHAGFIINLGNATAADVKALIKLIQDKVYADSGVTLEPEILFVGKQQK